MKKLYKVRLAPKKEGDKGEVVKAEYLNESACKKIHVVQHDGKVYFAADITLTPQYPHLCHFVGPAAVLRAM